MLKYRVIESTEALMPLQDGWERLRKACRTSVFTSFDWSIEWLRHFDVQARPRIVVIEEDRDLIGIAPFVLTEVKAVGVKMKRLSMVGNGGGMAQLYDLGIMYRGNVEDILDVVMRALNDIDWNVLHFDELREDNMSLALYRRISDMWEADDIVRIPCPRTALPPHGDVLDVVSSRTKRTIKKATADLEAESRLRYRTVDLPDETAEAAEMYALQHLQRWSDKGGSIFSNERLTSFLKEVMRASAHDGRGMVFEVWIDGSLASQMLCIEDGDTMRAYRVGMNNRFSEYSPGNLVAYQAMQEAQKAGFTQFDFGTGSEEFKYRLGAQDHPVMRIQAKRGAVRTLSKLTSLPFIKQVAERSGARRQALRAMHE